MVDFTEDEFAGVDEISGVVMVMFWRMLAFTF